MFPYLYNGLIPPDHTTVPGRPGGI